MHHLIITTIVIKIIVLKGTVYIQSPNVFACKFMEILLILLWMDYQVKIGSWQQVKST